MSGSLLQIATFGKQDVNLTANPNVTFWKTVFKRHTQFAMEPKELDPYGTVAWGQKNAFELQRQSDLIRRIFVKVHLGALTNARYTDDVGRAMFEEIQFEAGSVTIDRMYPEFTHVWEELTVDAERQLGDLTGNYKAQVSELTDAAATDQTLYIPLDFWFTRDPGMALPMTATYMSQIKIYFKTRSYDKVIVPLSSSYANPVGYVGAAPTLRMTLLIEGVLLDMEERSWFAQVSPFKLEYLIEQRQFQSTVLQKDLSNPKIDLRFSHPVKELIFLFRKRAMLRPGILEYFNFDGDEPVTNDSFKSMRLLLNQNERFMPLEPVYFRVLQPHMHHSRIPAANIYTYSFALYPEDLQPSGSLNFSRIDKVEVQLTFDGDKVKEDLEVLIFAVNYNTIKFQDGTCTLTWAS